MKLSTLALLLVSFLVSLASQLLHADEVEIVSAEFRQDSKGSWTIDVGLLHADSGWEHYANIWRVVDEQGSVLAERVLLHPHENEQPFVRGVDSVAIPPNSILYIEAHDLLHGWAEKRLEIDLAKAENGRLRITNP